jgi:hypothetical protein
MSKAINCPGSSFSRIQARFFSDQAEPVKRPSNHLGASIIVLFEPSGAACIPGGVCPCGLSAGAPPVPVSRGPVGPCGWVTPFMSGGSTVRPVLCGESAGCCGPDCVCADALPAHNARHKATIAVRMYDSCRLIRTGHQPMGETSVPWEARRPPFAVSLEAVSPGGSGSNRKADRPDSPKGGAKL